MPDAERAPWREFAWVLLLLLLPFGEGGATPGALFWVHSLILLVAFLELALPGGGLSAPSLLPPEIRTAAPLLVGLAVVASLGTPYLYASFLRCWDLAIALVVLVLSRRANWARWKDRLPGDAILLSAAFQALVVLGGAALGQVPQAISRFGLLNSNHQAAYLNLGILVAAPRLLGAGEKGRGLRGAGMVLCLLASCLLASRGAFAGLAAGALILLAIAWRQISPRLRVTACLVILEALAGGLLAIGRRFFLAGDPFPFQRIQIWQATLRCFAGSPWLGTGPGVFRHVAHRFNFPLDGPVRYGRTFETPHSDYLGVLVEMGVLGLLAGFLLLARAFAMVWRSRRLSPISLAALCALVSVAVQGLVEDLTQRPAILLSLAVLVAAASRVGEKQEPRFSPPLRMETRLGWLGIPVLFAWMVGVLNPYLGYRSDRAMRFASSLTAMDRHRAAALRANPYQADTYRFPAAAFLAADPPADLTPELYARFRRELDEGVRTDSTSADLALTRARLEARAFRTLFQDAASRDRALESYREGIRKAPHDPRPRVEAARLLLDLGRPAEALALTEAALADEPCFLAGRFLHAGILLEGGDSAGARQEWMAAESLRHQLSTYRPDSPYAADITRDNASLRQFLQKRLGTL